MAADRVAQGHGQQGGGYPQEAPAGETSVQPTSPMNPSVQSAPQAGRPAPAPPPPQMAPPMSPQGQAPRSSSKTASAGGSSGRSAPAPDFDRAPAPRREAEAAEAPAPTTRPGLGTEFGEARTSRVHDVTFVRDGGLPFAVASLNYNDRKGVDALAASAAARDSARSVATGGGAVTISVRDSNGDALEAVHVGDRTFVVALPGGSALLPAAAPLRSWDGALKAT